MGLSNQEFPSWRACSWRVAILAMWMFCLPGCGGAPGSRSDDETFPRRQMKIICPWSPGGGTDRVSRYWAEALEKKLGKPCVVVNRTGGGGATGHNEGARARADGHTITTITFELSTMRHMGIHGPTYDDYAPLLQVNADAAAILVQQDAKWSSLQEFLADAKTRPGEISMSGTAVGGAWDLARAALLRSAMLPTDAIAWIPKNGAAPSLQELLGGHIDSVCCSVPEATAQIENGQLRVLAVMAEQRLPGYPDIPTCKESGVDCVVVGWRGFAVPKATPAKIVDRLRQECLEIAQSDDFAKFMKTNDFGLTIRSGDAFRDFLAGQDEQWKDVIEAAYGKTN